MADYRAETETGSKVHYVLTGHATGWSAMAKAVREFDEEKVQDCKEDIDTLLVFAGLFSAVLSAFLLASLPALRPDPNDRMFAVLDRIAIQSASYSFQEGVFTTMAPPAQISTPFEASADDIRVNVLWFASLLLSLITASFGILVKQWLREFLAVDVPSPQARLRIRHFRAPAVESWRVFEIAAALPLLLQLSLGLFFIGLCYFTRSVHSSIGYTTIPLVAGWAFCIFTSTFLPIFFPRCPYKTRLLRRLVRSSYHYLNTTMNKVPSLAWSRFLRSYAFWDRQVWKLIWNVASNAHRYLQRVDEVRAVSSHAMDMQILASVDAIQSDDELLRSAILESVTQIQPTSKSIIDLIYWILEHRLQWGYSPAGIYGWHMAAIDLRPLTHQARAAVSEMLNLAVSHSDFDDLPTKWQEVNSNPQFLFAFMVSISLSVFSHPLPKNVLQFMKVSLSLHGQALCRIVASSALPSYVGFLILREGLLSLASTLNLQFGTCLNCFEAIVDASLNQLSHVTPSVPALIFERWNEDEARNLPWRDIFESETLLHSVIFLLDITGVAFKSSRETLTNIPSNARAAIITAFCIVRHIPSSDSETVGDKLWDLVAEARSSTRSATVLLDALLAAPTDWIFGARAGWFHVFEKYQDRQLREHETRTSGIDHLVVVLKERLTEPIPELSLLHIIFICVNVVDFTIMAPSDKQEGRTMLTSLAVRLDEIPLGPGPRRRAQRQDHAKECLSTIHRIEIGNQASSLDQEKYEEWNSSFDEENSPYPDALIEALARFVTTWQADDYSCWRLRRLKEFRKCRPIQC